MFANIDDSNQTMDSIITYIMSGQGDFGRINDWQEFLEAVKKKCEAGASGSDKEIPVASWRKFYRVINKGITDNRIFARDVVEENGETRIGDAMKYIKIVEEKSTLRKLYSFSSTAKADMLEDKKILIADDLELSIYQLITLLKKIGAAPRAARHKEEALSELQKAQFDCIIIDLFMPDSSDGIELIKASVQKRKETGFNSKIIVISGTDDDSLINKCYELGADFYIKKDSGWHSKLMQYISASFQTDKNSAFRRRIFNDTSVCYMLKRFNEQKILDAVLKDINYSVYSGQKNVILDLTEVALFDIDNAYIFAEIYKMCSENGGKFILVKPSLKVKEALAFAYLEDVIKCTESIDEALKLIPA